MPSRGLGLYSQSCLINDGQIDWIKRNKRYVEGCGFNVNDVLKRVDVMSAEDALYIIQSAIRCKYNIASTRVNMEVIEDGKKNTHKQLR